MSDRDRRILKRNCRKYMCEADIKNISDFRKYSQKYHPDKFIKKYPQKGPEYDRNLEIYTNITTCKDAKFWCEDKAKMEEEEKMEAEMEARERAEMEARERAQREAEMEARERAQREAEMEAQERARREAEMEAQERARREMEARERAQREAEMEARERAQREAEILSNNFLHSSPHLYGMAAAVHNPIPGYSSPLQLQGIAQNGASPTDQFIITSAVPMKFQLGLNKISTTSLFAKVYINPRSLPTNYNKDKNIIWGGYYEYLIYTNIITKILDQNISPHFIRYYSANGLNYEQYVKSIMETIGVKNHAHISKYNIDRNIYYMYNQMASRPALDDNSVKFSDIDMFDVSYLTTNVFPHLNFDILKLQNTSQPHIRPLNEFFVNMLNNPKLSFDYFQYVLYIILFQIAQACYSMFLSRTVHNDLHLGNIFISERTSHPIKIRYFIDDIPYDVQTNICCRIYDFDRAFSEQLGNNPLNDYNMYCLPAHYCNLLNTGPKDFVKFLCQIYSHIRNKVTTYNAPVSTALLTNLLSIIIPDLSNELVFNGIKLSDYFYASTTSPYCINQYMPYHLFNSYPEIMKRIHFFLNQAMVKLNISNIPASFIFKSRRKDFDDKGKYIINDCCGDDFQ